MPHDYQKRSVLLITGMSGSGKSFALKTLEDMGFETIDNLPLSLLKSVALAEWHSSRPLAVSVDVRTRDFSAEQFLEEYKTLGLHDSMKTQLVFFDCDVDVLSRRYNETRRLHPLAHERPVNDGLRLERNLTALLREKADLVVDTSLLSTSELRGQMRRYFLPKLGPELSIFVTSFSYRFGLPREADMVFDARLLRNPYYTESLRALTGEDEKVESFIRKDEALAPFMDTVQRLISGSLPRFEEEGRGYLTIAVGCTGGQHRSVFVAKNLVEWLQTMKKKVKLNHRDIKKEKKR